MKNRAKVMIAYDGSNCADAAIDDLRRAGLPRVGEAVIVSVSDTLITNSLSISETVAKSVISRRAMSAVKLLEEQSALALTAARDFALKASRRVQAQLPEWKISYEVSQGTPADELLRRAAEWKPDLILVGSHGRGAIGRFFLGSVSKRIAEEVNCSVRVARRGFEKNANTLTKIIVGASTLPDVERVIRAVGRRVWSDETEVRLVVVDDGVSAGRVSAVYPYAKAIYELSVDELRAVGLQVSVDIKSGNPKTVLLEEAENWEADSIFVVADGEGAGLNGTAASLITGANCTVEIVR